MDNMPAHEVYEERIQKILEVHQLRVDQIIDLHSELMLLKIDIISGEQVDVLQRLTDIIEKAKL